MYSFHQNQVETSEQIIRVIMSPNVMGMVLLAQMQSGKTGTYLKVALESVENGHVDHVMIISGSRDTSLMGQTKQDLVNAIESYCSKYVDGELVLRVGLKSKLTDRIQVYWSQDLHKVTNIEDNTLIIHDESHAAQSKNNLPYRNFYAKHGLEKALYGDDSQLRERNIRLLNVSATPFSELICNEKVRNDLLNNEERSIINDIPLTEKSIIFGKPGDSYKGITYFLRNGCIRFESEKISDKSSDHIKRILRKTKYVDKYCIIRTRCAKKDELLMRTIARVTGCEYIPVFQSKPGEDASTALDFLKDPPTSKTLVHICGKARMGQVLDKTHIGFVYEQSRNPNTDTILQGLLGRMCGYYDTPIPDIYVSPKVKHAIEQYSHGWEQSEITSLRNIRKAMNLNGSQKHTNGKIVKDKDGKPWIKIVPIPFTVDDCKDDGESSFGSTTKNEIINMFQDKPELIEGNPDKDTILEMIPNRPCGRRNIDQQSYRVRGQGGVKQTLEDSSRQGIRETCWFSNCITDFNTPEVKPFQIIGSDKNSYNPEGKVFLIGFVPYKPPIHGPMDTTFLPNVLKKCNYVISTITMENDETIENINGGQIIPFPFETSNKPSLLVKELYKAIKRTDPSHRTYIEGCRKSIYSMHDKPSSAPKGIALSARVYNPEMIARVIEYLERKCNVKLTLKKSRGRQPSGYIRYVSISWN